jgi:hypothetical protein
MKDQCYDSHYRYEGIVRSMTMLSLDHWTKPQES